MATVQTLFGAWEERHPKAHPWPENADEHFYVLDASRRPVPASEDEWTAWSESAPSNVTTVAVTDLGRCQIVTSFDGEVQADEDKEGEAPLFWTRAYVDCDDDDVDTYSTWEAAEAGHRAAVERYKALYGA